MRIDININVNLNDMSDELLKELRKMSAAMDRVKTEVSELKTVNAGVIALVSGLAQQIRDNATDEAALTAIADELDAESTALAAAVAVNTPA